MNAKYYNKSTKPNFSLITAALQDKISRDLSFSVSSSGSITRPKRKKRNDNTLTLAQKMGLEKLPPPKLTEEEWNEVAMKSRKRNDSCHPCAICQEPFKLKKQVTNITYFPYIS